MITTKHLSAVLGFAFVAAWASLGFGDAVLCLLGAAVAYAIPGVLEGDIDLGELQQRVRRPGGAETPAPAAQAFPRSSGGPRVR